MARQTRSALTILACSGLLLLAGCGLTLGPVVKTRYIIVKPGLPVEILESKVLRCRLVKDEKGDAVKQDVGGWIAMHPDHWDSVKKEIERLRKKGQP